MTAFYSRRSRLAQAFVLFATLIGVAQAQEAPKIAPRLQPFVDDGTVAGVVTLVATPQQVLDVEAVGWADVAARKPMTTDAVFWIASQSKPITGAALMILVDEGKVDVEDPVEKYLPEFKDVRVAVPGGEPKPPAHPIKVREILSHTSGLPFSSPIEKPTLDLFPLAERVRSYTTVPLLFEPGTKSQYSNAGINTAGRIIEVVSGMPYETFLNERIFKPLGMVDATFRPTGARLARVAKSYKPVAGKLEETTISQLKYPLDSLDRQPMPAGGLFATADDVRRFYQMLANDGVFEGKRILSEKAVRMMTSDQSGEAHSHYGFGIGVGGDGKTFSHGGAYGTDSGYDKGRRLITVFLVQQASWTDRGKTVLPTFKKAAFETFESKSRAAAAADAPKPNIVVLLADDLGFGDVGCFGHPRIKTPVIDGLAREGARLTSMYAGAPVCSPSRAAMFSGRNPNRVGVRDWIDQGSGVHLDRSAVTVAQRLKEAGYTTCLAGKWHLNSKFDGQEPTPGDFGFDYWFATQNNAKHQDPTNYVRNGKRVGPLKGHDTSVMVDETISFIEKAGDRPFAAFVTFHAPHEQIETPAEYKAMYSDVADETTRDYYGSVTLIDHEVGRLLAALDAHGLREKTLVVFTSDNGPEGYLRYPKAIHSHGSASPLRGMKLSMFEGGFRVPGVVRWPGRVKPGTEIAEPVAFYDLLPTFCALAGTTPTGPTDGANVQPLLEGRVSTVDRSVPLHWQYDNSPDGPWRLAVRRGPWKLLADADRRQFALFNLAEDVAEAHDKAAEHPEIVKELSADLNRLYVPPKS
ncbi:serine hydrolase [Paludisphaera rhizosphaerae]|uniref:serine hydrolase n=1 Tax=Paludisphaera rhizosphaerae TaxID=2711216 RepID=UPI001980F83D|nr:serine hydrolase [Paludisphaera rhizosphaerae]